MPVDAPVMTTDLLISISALPAGKDDKLCPGEVKPLTAKARSSQSILSKS
jgi:hypothetical protein